MTPPEFFKTLKISQFIVINDEIKNGSGLEKICFACSFFCGSPYAIHKV